MRKLHFQHGTPSHQGPPDADASKYLMPYLPFFFSICTCVLLMIRYSHQLFCTDVPPAIPVHFYELGGGRTLFVNNPRCRNAVPLHLKALQPLPSRHCTTVACLQRSPMGRLESFRSWSSHLFHGRPGGRCHVRSGRSDTLTRS